MEFLVEIEVTIPLGLPDDERERVTAMEVQRGKELVEAGTIVRIWRIPGRTANVGVWSATDASALHAAISSLPMFPYLSVRVTPLAVHHLEA